MVTGASGYQGLTEAVSHQVPMGSSRVMVPSSASSMAHMPTTTLVREAARSLCSVVMGLLFNVAQPQAAWAVTAPSSITAAWTPTAPWFSAASSTKTASSSAARGGFGVGVGSGVGDGVGRGAAAAIDGDSIGAGCTWPQPARSRAAARRKAGACRGKGISSLSLVSPYYNIKRQALGLFSAKTSRPDGSGARPGTSSSRRRARGMGRSRVAVGEVAPPA